MQCVWLVDVYVLSSALGLALFKEPHTNNGRFGGRALACIAATSDILSLYDARTAAWCCS